MMFYLYTIVLCIGVAGLAKDNGVYQSQPAYNDTKYNIISMTNTNTIRKYMVETQTLSSLVAFMNARAKY